MRSPSRFYPCSALSFCRVPERPGGHVWWKRGGSGRRNEDDGRFDASTLRCRFPFAQQPALLRRHQWNRLGARQPFVRGGQGENGSKGSRRTWAIGSAQRPGETSADLRDQQPLKKSKGAALSFSSKRPKAGQILGRICPGVVVGPALSFQKLTQWLFFVGEARISSPSTGQPGNAGQVPHGSLRLCLPLSLLQPAFFPARRSRPRRFFRGFQP